LYPQHFPRSVEAPPPSLHSLRPKQKYKALFTKKRPGYDVKLHPHRVLALMTSCVDGPLSSQTKPNQTYSPKQADTIYKIYNLQNINQKEKKKP
jgi:hypothetical protein